MVRYCTNCNAAIPEGAKFCPHCGTVAPPEPVPEVVTPPAPIPSTPVPAVVPPPARQHTALLIGIPVALLVIALILWAVLAGMPFGGKTQKISRTEQPEPSVINEQQGGSSTISEIRAPGEQPPPPTTTTMMEPPLVTTTTMMPQPPPVTTTMMPPVTTTTRRPPVTVTTQPVPFPTESTTSAAPPARREMTESEAENVLRGYITSRDYYRMPPECVGIAGGEYENRGYTLDVVDRCGDRGRIGRWRVDSVTREVFKQQGDGRYLRP